MLFHEQERQFFGGQSEDLQRAMYEFWQGALQGQMDTVHNTQPPAPSFFFFFGIILLCQQGGGGGKQQRVIDFDS